MCVSCYTFYLFLLLFVFSSRRRHTRCALVTGVQRVLFRSLANPLAHSGMALTVDEVMHSRRIAGPIKMFDCCLYSEGAAALILASEDRAREIRSEERRVGKECVSTGRSR